MVQPREDPWSIELRRRKDPYQVRGGYVPLPRLEGDEPSGPPHGGSAVKPPPA